MKSFILDIVCVFLMVQSASAFSSSTPSFTPMKRIQGSSLTGSSSVRSLNTLLRMADADEAAKLLEQARKLREEAAVMAGVDEEEEAAAEVNVSADGTFYDDEVSPVVKDGLSSSMRERLIREASTGLDSEQKQTNVILYISIAVVLLVIAGGGGILY